MRKKQGFTLMELLIVIAIIVVLVAVSIPVFSGQLEKSREAVDLATIRQVIAELKTEAMSEEIDTSKFYNDNTKNEIRACILCQGTKSGWQTKGLKKDGSGVMIADAVCYAADTSKPYLCIYINKSTGAIRFNREASVKKPLYN